MKVAVLSFFEMNRTKKRTDFQSVSSPLPLFNNDNNDYSHVNLNDFSNMTSISLNNINVNSYF